MAFEAKKSIACLSVDNNGEVTAFEKEGTAILMAKIGSVAVNGYY